MVNENFWTAGHKITTREEDDRELARLTALYLVPAAEALSDKVNNGEPLTELELRVLSWIIYSPRPDRLN